MRRISLLFGLLLFASHGRANEDPMFDLKKGQPKDVVVVIERIAMCTHFAGEEPYDAGRRREIAAAMKKYRCDRLSKDETALKKRHKDNPDIHRALQQAHAW